MAPQVLEKKIALLFKNRTIVITFLVSSQLNLNALRQVSRNQKGDQRLCNLKEKKKKGSSRRIYSCFFTHNGITTPKTTREGQESTTKTSLHLA